MKLASKSGVTAALFLGFATASSAFALPKRGVPIARPENLPTLYMMPNEYDFNGIVKLSNCSGSLVRLESSQDSDKALILTNGHCVDYAGNGGMLPANRFVANQNVSRSFRFLKPNGDLGTGRVSSTKILYATMTGTDLALYELSATYKEIADKYQVDALVIAKDHPVLNDRIEILSGYWQTGYSCSIDAFIYQMKEDDYTWSDSVRYSEGCKTIHGTSGSPVVSTTSGKVVAVNNTGNDDGERCTLNNPCEISESGEVTYKKGVSYA